MNNIGTQEIRTERLLLRKIKKSDYKDVFRYASREEVAKYLTWTAHKSIKDTKALCKMWAEEYKKDNIYRWAIVYNNTVIGTIDVMSLIKESAFMGWCIDSLHWNKGIMTEAAAAVRDYLFGKVGIKQMLANFITENAGSGKVMEKIGMKVVSCEEYAAALEKTCEYEYNGMPISCKKLTKAQWEAAQKPNRTA